MPALADAGDHDSTIDFANRLHGLPESQPETVLQRLFKSVKPLLPKRNRSQGGIDDIVLDEL